MHISEDKLLEYVLEITENDKEQSAIEEHLEACQSCHSRLKELRSDIDVISSVRPHRPVGVTPVGSRRHNAVYPLLRAAALIVIGLGIGYGASVWQKDEPARVVSQYMRLSVPADSVSRYAPSDATDASADYYRRTYRHNQ